MTNYDHTETFGLYAAMLRKTRSVAVPAGERRRGCAGRRCAWRLRRRRSRWPRRCGAVAQRVPTAQQAVSRRPVPRRARRCRPSRSTSTDSQHRILAVPGIPERQYSNLKAGVAGMVYFLEAAAVAAAAAAARAVVRRCIATRCATIATSAVRHGRGGLRREPRRAQARCIAAAAVAAVAAAVVARRAPAAARALPRRRRSQSAAGWPGSRRTPTCARTSIRSRSSSRSSTKRGAISATTST